MPPPLFIQHRESPHHPHFNRLPWAVVITVRHRAAHHLPPSLRRFIATAHCPQRPVLNAAGAMSAMPLPTPEAPRASHRNPGLLSIHAINPPPLISLRDSRHAHKNLHTRGSCVDCANPPASTIPPAYRLVEAICKPLPPVYRAAPHTQFSHTHVDMRTTDCAAAPCHHLPKSCCQKPPRKHYSCVYADTQETSPETSRTTSQGIHSTPTARTSAWGMNESGELVFNKGHVLVVEQGTDHSD